MRSGRLIVIAVLVLATMPASASESEPTVTRKRIAPSTLGRVVHLASPARVGLDFPASHATFSWAGAEGSAIAFSVRRAGGQWSEWREAPEDHDASTSRRKVSGILLLDRADQIRWRASGERRDTVRAVELGYVNTIDGPKQAMRGPQIAPRTIDGPPIVTRAGWGADESLKRTSGSCKRRFFPVQQLVVHHTVTRNSDPDPAATVRAIYWFHVAQRGWCDIAYNFLIAPDGRIFEGRWARSYAPWEIHSGENADGEGVVGSHASNVNPGSVGISMLGNYSTARVADASRRSLAELLAWKAERHDLKPRSKHTYVNPDTGRRRWLPVIAGHRDAGQTSCPGTNLYKALPGIRRDVSAIMEVEKASSVMVLGSASPETVYGSTASVTGKLTDEMGVGLADRTVTLYKRRKLPGARWWVHRSATTNLDGAFAFDFKPYRNLVVQAVFHGDPVTWGSQSNRVQLPVVPLIAISAEEGTDAGGTATFPPGTTEVRLLGRIYPIHTSPLRVLIERTSSTGVYEPILSVSVRPTSTGEFAYVFEPGLGSEEGAYRVTVSFDGDADHRPTDSEPYNFVIG